jgi:hypothetical protein
MYPELLTHQQFWVGILHFLVYISDSVFKIQNMQLIEDTRFSLPSDVTPCSLLIVMNLLEKSAASSTLMMEAVCSTETLVTIYQITKRHIPEDTN